MVTEKRGRIDLEEMAYVMRGKAAILRHCDVAFADSLADGVDMAGISILADEIYDLANALYDAVENGEVIYKA